MSKTHSFPKEYQVGKHLGRPAFLVDGQPETLSSYCSCGPLWRDQWMDAHRNFVKHGAKIFWLMPPGGFDSEWGTTPFWTAPGKVHSPPAPMPEGYFSIDDQARAIIAMQPEARFFIRTQDQPPKSWADRCPDEMLLNSEGRRYDSPSMASEQYIAESAQFFRALTRHCEQSEWADRIVGYVIYPLGEGTNPLTGEGYLFDRSPVMRQAFRKFLRDKYGSDAALRQAWGDASVSLETVDIPNDNDFRTRADAPILFWPEARQVRRELDYFELQRPLFRRYLKNILGAVRAEAGPKRLCGIDALKGNMLGWMTYPIFVSQGWKEHYGDQFLAVGTAGMSEILDWPELDLVATPHDYRNRWLGFGFDPEGVGDSIVLHGKVMLIEEDQRSHTNNERGLFGSIEPGEEEAILYRNLAATLTRGHHTYPMDVCVGYFQSDPIQQVLHRRREIEETFLHVKRQDVSSIVMLVDDRASSHTDFSAEYNDLAVIRQRIYGMNHCGVPTKTYLFDDLNRDDFPTQHKLYLLPNLYRFDQKTLALLRTKLFRDGNVIVFGPGTGITDGEKVSGDWAQQYLGFECEMFPVEYPRFVTIDGWDHPLASGFGALDSFGDTHRYGPVLVPREGDPSVKRIGTIAFQWGKRRAGLAIKEFGRGAAGNGTPGPRGAGDYATVFTAAVPLPARLLRNLARYSGTHVYSDTDDVIFADTASVALHTAMPGPRVLRLPGKFEVTDVVTDARFADDVSEIRFEVDKPTTRWFRLL